MPAISVISHEKCPSDGRGRSPTGRRGRGAKVGQKGRSGGASQRLGGGVDGASAPRWRALRVPVISHFVVVAPAPPPALCRIASVPVPRDDGEGAGATIACRRCLGGFPRADAGTGGTGGGARLRKTGCEITENGGFLGRKSGARTRKNGAEMRAFSVISHEKCPHRRHSAIPCDNGFFRRRDNCSRRPPLPRHGAKKTPPGTRTAVFRKAAYQR